MGTIDENYFKMPEVTQNNSIEEILDSDETVLLRQKPKKKAYIFNSIAKFLPLSLIWFIFDAGFICMMIFVDVPKMVWFFVIPFFALHMTPVWIGIANIVRAGKSWKNLEYVFTDKRIIIRSGVIGINIANVYYADIKGVNLRVGIFDRLFKVGDIYITAAEQSQVLYDLENAHFLLKRIQKIVLDLKTDVYFPNDLRPKTNSGYKTKYRPED
ncbi:MAG: PH domain-containing protein [Clostridia bacterium]|nr:PH domain-containing protein [Clostridia bacterium]